MNDFELLARAMVDTKTSMPEQPCPPSADATAGAADAALDEVPSISTQETIDDATGNNCTGLPPITRVSPVRSSTVKDQKTFKDAFLNFIKDQDKKKLAENAAAQNAVERVIKQLQAQTRLKDDRKSMMKTTTKRRKSTIVRGKVVKKPRQKWRLIRKNMTNIKANVTSGAAARDDEAARDVNMATNEDTPTQYEATSEQVRILVL